MIMAVNVVGSLAERGPQMSSLKTKVREVVIIGSFGLEHRNENQWKAVGLGEQMGRQFTLQTEKIGKWRVNGTSLNGFRRRERFIASDLGEAVGQASRILYGCPLSEEHPQLDLATAFDRFLKSGGGSDAHKKNLRQFAGYFCVWAETKHLTHWHQLRFEHIRTYMMGMFERGLKSSTVGHYLEPIRATSRFISANWPEYYRDICGCLRLPNNAGRDMIYHDHAGIPHLSFAEVLDFIGWLKTYVHGQILIPSVMLQGLCGLQLGEALRLRQGDTDLAKGTITIQGHPELGEGVKNQYRIRRIPLPNMVWNYLRQGESQKSKPVPYEGDYVAYGKLLKRALHKWDPSCEIAPKDLRKTLQTHAMEHAMDEGWNTYLVDRYVGHAPKTLAERHYFGDKRFRMVEVFREHVAVKIDGLVDGIQGSKWHEMAQIIDLHASREKTA